MRVIPFKKSNLDHQDQDQAQAEGLQIALYLSYSFCFDDMTEKIRYNKDEYDINFECGSDMKTQPLGAH